MTETATFAISLDDNTSGAASSAAKSLSNLRDKIQGDIGALREMQAAMKQMKGGASMNIEAYNKLKGAIAAKHATIAKAQQDYVLLGGTFGKTGDEAKAAAEKMSALGGLIGQASPKVSGMIGSAGKLVKMLGSAGLAGVALAAGVAIVAMGATLAVANLKMADAIRTERIQMQALASLGKAYRSLTPEMAAMGGGMWSLISGKAAAATQAEGDALTSMVGRVTDQFAIGRDQVLGYTKSLMKARLTGKNLEKTLESAAIMSSVFGEDAAEQFIGMAKQAALFGSSASSVAANVKNKFGAMARSLKLGLGEQFKQLKTNLGKLFTGINIEGFLKGLQGVVSLFSQSTVTGRALKSLITVILQPMYDQVAKLGPILENLWLGMTIGALLVTVEVLKVKNAVRDMIGKDTLANFDWLTAVMYVGIGVCLLLGGAVAFVVVAFAGLGAMAKIAADGISWVVDQILWADKNFHDLSWGDIGSGLIYGLVEGMKAAAGAVWDTIKWLGSGIKSAFTSEMQMHSPSRVFFGYGVNMGQGAVLGMQSVQPQVETSTANMVSMPSTPMPSAESYSSVTNNSQKGNTIINNISIDGAGKDSKSIAKEVWQYVQDHLEGEVITIGGELLTT